MATKKQENLGRVAEMSIQAREKDRKGLIKRFQSERKIQVSVSPFYKPYFGSVAMISVQGISVHVPVNSKTYTVPQTFAEHLHEAIADVDKAVQRNERLSNVSGNFEKHVGALKF